MELAHGISVILSFFAHPPGYLSCCLSVLGGRKWSYIHLTKRHDIAAHNKRNSQKKCTKALAQGAYATSKLHVGRLLKLKTMVDLRARKLQSLLHICAFVQPFQRVVFQLSWILSYCPLLFSAGFWLKTPVLPPLQSRCSPQMLCGRLWRLQRFPILHLGQDLQEIVPGLGDPLIFRLCSDLLVVLMLLLLWHFSHVPGKSTN